MNGLGIITGLDSESRCLVAPRDDETPVLVRIAGADTERATTAARALLLSGCDGLMSFGMAGGLDPGLAPGSVVLARHIIGEAGEVFPVDPAWHERLCALLAGGFAVADGTIVGSGHMIDGVAAKVALHESTAAIAVDMESAAIAEVAALAGVPFIAVRAIADPAGRAPATWAMEAVRPDGRVDTLAAIRLLICQPSAIPAAVAMARDSRAALKTLRGVALRAGPLFGRC